MIDKIRQHAWGIGILVAMVLYLTISYNEIAQPDFIPAGTMPNARSGMPEIVLAAKPGKPLVINFFASWCNICDAEPPYLNKLADQLRANDGQLIGIASNDTRGGLQRSGKMEDRLFPLGFDRDGSYSEQLRVSAVPHTIVVDQQGKIVYQVRGRLNARHVAAIGQHLKSMQQKKL